MSVGGRTLGQRALGSGIEPQAPKKKFLKIQIWTLHFHLMNFIVNFKNQSSPSKKETLIKRWECLISAFSIKRSRKGLVPILLYSLLSLWLPVEQRFAETHLYTLWVYSMIIQYRNTSWVWWYTPTILALTRLSVRPTRVHSKTRLLRTQTMTDVILVLTSILKFHKSSSSFLCVCGLLNISPSPSLSNLPVPSDCPILPGGQPFSFHN